MYFPRQDLIVCQIKCLIICVFITFSIVNYFEVKTKFFSCLLQLKNINKSFTLQLTILNILGLLKERIEQLLQGNF